MWTHSHRVVSLDLICLNPSAQGAYQFEKQGRERTPAHKRPLPCYLLVPFLHWDWVRAPHNCFSILFYVSPSLSVSGCLVLSFTHSPCLSHTLSTHSDTVSKDILPSYSRNSKLLFCCCCCFLLHSPSPLCSHPQLSLLVRFPCNISALSSFFQLSDRACRHRMHSTSWRGCVTCSAGCMCLSQPAPSTRFFHSPKINCSILALAW